MAALIAAASQPVKSAAESADFKPSPELLAARASKHSVSKAELKMSMVRHYFFQQYEASPRPASPTEEAMHRHMRSKSEVKVEELRHTFFAEEDAALDAAEALEHPESDEEPTILHRHEHFWTREAHFKMYLFMEEASSSWPAFILSCTILVCVILSCMSFLLETTVTLSADAHPEYENTWFWIEACFSGVFSAEFLARFAVSPLSKFMFLTNPMNVVDVMAVLPFWVQVVTAAKSNFQFLRIFRLIRIFRLFKLARFSSHLRIITVACAASGDAFVILGLFLGMSSTIFAALIWFVECGEWDKSMGCFVRVLGDERSCSPFPSVPESYYWALATMTTVGYGDVTAITENGHTMSNIAMLCGVLVLAMPVSVLGPQFQETFAKVKNELDEESRQQEAALCVDVDAEPVTPAMKAQELMGNLDALMVRLNDALVDIRGCVSTVLEEEYGHGPLRPSRCTSGVATKVCGDDDTAASGAGVFSDADAPTGDNADTREPRSSDEPIADEGDDCRVGERLCQRRVDEPLAPIEITVRHLEANLHTALGQYQDWYRGLMRMDVE
eukprot:NODE_2708_length_2160_cov_15.199213.p1 GENE.NODE_2708_length_2160_cov_15.199213~~NODE_2708_length_2160_cov_15.199213.p1  ORF type:complete len:558 (-),score=145.33 NODE_2708_length_2160_cov_15.199213:359-2032(-)